MSSTMKRVFFDNYAFNVPEDVYEPAEDSFLFAENMRVRKGDYVLDVGTGCGILGIIAAKIASEVIAVDLNPHAIACAKENAKLNHTVRRMSFIRTDLLSGLKPEVKFDLILFNAPYLPSTGDSRSWLGIAWDGGPTGRRIIDRFICTTPEHLKPEGQIMLMQSTLSDVDETLRMFKERGMGADIVSQLGLPFFETVVLIRAKHW